MEPAIRERLHDMAGGNLAATTLRDHPLEFTPQLLKLSDLALDSEEVAAGNLVSFAAVSIGLIRQV